MRRYTVDTNLFIAAFRNEAEHETLRNFFVLHSTAAFAHAVVMQEPLIGAKSVVEQRQTYATFIAPFERRRRVVTPSYSAWRRSAEVVAKLVERKHISRGGYAPSFLNDVLLAVSCREAGVTLVTANNTDFERIAEVEPFDFALPWPS